MSDPGEKRKRALSTLIMLLLLVALVYALFRVSGGDFSSLLHPGNYAGGGGPITRMVDSLRGFGQGLRGMFNGLIH